MFNLRYELWNISTQMTIPFCKYKRRDSDSIKLPFDNVIAKFVIVRPFYCCMLFDALYNLFYRVLTFAIVPERLKDSMKTSRFITAYHSSRQKRLDTLKYFNSNSCIKLPFFYCCNSMHNKRIDR